MGSPALAEAESMYEAIVQEGGDPAIALAFFEHESSGGKAGVAVFTHSLGNLRCTPGYSCYQTENNGAFRSYPNWTEGARDWTRLMAHYYRDELGLTTLEQILPVYVPTSDGNAPASYLQAVKSRVDQLRRQEWEYGPHGSPYHAPYVVTQEYGCTSFREFADADCAASSGGTKPYFHRGVDLVGLGDKTIYATLSGTVDYAGEGEDGFGMRVYLRKGPYLVIYAHLSRLLVTTGQMVQPGQPLGIEGSSGYSTGFHLHYEVHVGGQWVDSAPFLLPVG
jgi:murein DD-endopeptidase MepM/ murein hydrolase activator NlpD